MGLKSGTYPANMHSPGKLGQICVFMPTSFARNTALRLYGYWLILPGTFVCWTTSSNLMHHSHSSIANWISHIVHNNFCCFRPHSHLLPTPKHCSLKSNLCPLKLQNWLLNLRPRDRTFRVQSTTGWFYCGYCRVQLNRSPSSNRDRNYSSYLQRRPGYKTTHCLIMSLKCCNQLIKNMFLWCADY